MAKSELARNFRGALLIAEKEYVRAWSESRPTRDGIALNRGDVSTKILGNGKQGEHRLSQERSRVRERLSFPRKRRSFFIIPVGSVFQRSPDSFGSAATSRSGESSAK